MRQLQEALLKAKLISDEDVKKENKEEKKKLKNQRKFYNVEEKLNPLKFKEV